MKKILFLFYIFLLVSCRLDIVEELTSSHSKIKSITVNIDYPDGCFAYSIVRTNLSTSHSIVLESGETTYSSDSGVVVKAIGSYGYLFSEWIGEDIADSQSNSTSVLLDINKTITGKFIIDPNPKRVTIRARVLDGGEIDFGINMNEYRKNGDVYYSPVNVSTTVIIKAIPYEGYKFSHWLGDGIRDVKTNDTYLLVPPYSTTIEAVFDKEIIYSDTKVAE